jgi:hypothetical protein
MRRGAKITGWVTFTLSALALGAVVLALLSIRSPLADGSMAPGPAPAAYVIGLTTVVAGAAVAGLAMAGLVEALARLLSRR